MNLDHATLRADLIAGITVFTVLVPSAMAYGELAGVTAEAGMYAGLVAMVIYAALGSSRHLIIGPEATSALLTAMIVAPIAGAGAEPERFVHLVGALAAIVGATLILGGIVRIGFLADFLARAVLTGYITGAALLVIQSQLAKLFGIKLGSDDFFQSLLELATRLAETHAPTLLLGSATIVALLVMRRFLPKVPSSLIVVSAGIVLSAVFDWAHHGIRIVGEVKAGLPTLGIPHVGLSDLKALLPGAASMALLAFSDAVLTGRSFAGRHGYPIDANRELFALGAANLGTALSGAFPVAASGSRTAVNDSCGARSKLSGAVAAVMMVVFLLFFTPILFHLPLVVLGAIIIVSSLGMIEIGELIRMYRFRWETITSALVTLLGVLVVGIVPGILVAVTVSLFMVIAVISRPGDMQLVRENGALAFRPIGDGPLAQVEPGLIVYRQNGLLMFANAGRFKSRFLDLVGRSSGVKAVVLDLEMSPDTDLTALTAIEELRDDLGAQGVRLMTAEANPALRELFRRAGTDRKLGAENIHADVASAIESFRHEGLDRR